MNDARWMKWVEGELERGRTQETATPDLGAALGRYLALSELRGFWPMSSVNESGNIVDLSGQGRTLSNNGPVTRGLLASGVPVGGFNGTSAYLARTDEAGLDFLSYITLGGWFYRTANATNAGLISKAAGTVATNNFALYCAGSTVSFHGYAGAATDCASPNGSLPLNAWTFLVGKFTSSAEISLFVNASKLSTTTGVPAALNNSADPLKLGLLTSWAYFPGNMALCFLCAYPVPDAVLANLYQSSRGLFGV